MKYIQKILKYYVICDKILISNKYRKPTILSKGREERMRKTNYGTS